MKDVVPARIFHKFNIFLSYRSVEARFADKLKQHLIEDFIGLVEVFLASDTTSIPAGSKWLEEIVKGLRKSELHIIICSSYSVYRPWINYEAGAAKVRGVPIVPLCHSGLIPEQLPVPLSESQGGVITQASGLKKLYAQVAECLGSSIPEVNFEQYAEEFKRIEEQCEQYLKNEAHITNSTERHTASPKVYLIPDPRVVCVTSEQFKQLGYENQLQIVLQAFPQNIDHRVVSSSTELREILLEKRVDIVHIAAFVCPRGGDLYFSDVELPLGKSNAKEVDYLSADALVALFNKANTRLVVLGGSASLVLADQLLPITNVIAAQDMVSAEAMASWVSTFYTSLREETLTHSNDLASTVSRAPMKLYAQQNQPTEIDG